MRNSRHLAQSNEEETMHHQPTVPLNTESERDQAKKEDFASQDTLFRSKGEKPFALPTDLCGVLEELVI